MHGTTAAATFRRNTLYSGEDLRPLISPRSVAIVGVSTSGKGFGSLALAAMQGAKPDMPIYIVHPRFASEPAMPGTIGVVSIADLPEPVDCVMIAVPAMAVVAVVEAAARRGCGSTLIFSSGFGEVEGGAEAEAQLAEIARRTGIRIGGPNTAGILNYRETLPLTFVSDLGMDLPAGNLAIVSQSAGLATHLGHRRHRDLRISYTISTGNSVDVTALDYVNCLLDDPGTDAIMLALEGLDIPEGLDILGRKARATGKAVLAMKTGRTKKGGKAAVSHTGSLAGSHEVFEAAAEAAGIPLFRSPEELLETAQLFARWAKKPFTANGGVGVLTTMGGPGVISADAADDYGVDLPVPSDSTVTGLRQLVPAFAAVGNPIDTSASPKDDDLRQCLEIVAKDENFSAVVMLAATMTGPSTAQRPAAIAAAVRASAKPIAAVWLSTWWDGPGSEELDAEQELPVFRSIPRCMQAIATWVAWHKRLAEPEAADEPRASQVDVARLSDEVARARSEGAVATALSEATSRDILATLGVDMPKADVATTRDQAIAIAQSFGFPVVAKVVSADVPHKAAAGGVKIGLNDAAAVGDAFDAIMRDVAAHVPGAVLDGVLIAEMVKVDGEFMCGMVRDPVFGPVVLCGAGGAAVEELRDIGRCVGRVTPASARRAIGQVAAFRRLRAKNPDRAAHLETQLTGVLIALSQAAAAEPDLAEIDINPVVLRADNSLVALDALAVLA